MDHSSHVPLTPAELTDEILVGAPVYDHDDNKLGTIDHVHHSAASLRVVIDVGGFLGIGSKRVQLALDQLDMMRDQSGQVHGVTAWTKDQLKDLPEHHD
jgi:hypothetical protein